MLTVMNTIRQRRREKRLSQAAAAVAQAAGAAAASVARTEERPARDALVHTEQGSVFTMKEYRQWLKDAGFKKVTMIEAPSPSPLILATK